MSWERKDRLNSVVKAYDPLLSVEKDTRGILLVKRKMDCLAESHYGQMNLENPYSFSIILSLTDNWKPNGQPVDWGIEPIMETLRGMDAWNADTFEDMVKRRERAAEDKKRIRDNDYRARALDMRKDFARLTNDINTSSLSMDDPRRKQDGNL